MTMNEILTDTVEKLTDNLIEIAVIGTGLYLFVIGKTPEALVGFMGMIITYHFTKKV